MVEKTITHEGLDLHYWDLGEGQPLLLIHGFAEDHRIWKYQAAALQHRYRLLIPDLPGSGRSPRNAATPFPSIETLAAAVRAILDQENISQTVMAGHSMGGYISLAFAQTYPGRLKGLGLVHSTAYADDAPKVAARQRGMDFIRKHGSAAFLEQSIPNLFSPAFRNSHPDKVAGLIEQYRGFDPASLTGYYEAMIRRPDRTRVLLEFPGAVLFIIGKQDTAVPLEQSLQQCHLPQLSYIHLLEKAGHMGMWEEPDKTSEALASFLEDICQMRK